MRGTKNLDSLPNPDGGRGRKGAGRRLRVIGLSCHRRGQDTFATQLPNQSLAAFSDSVLRFFCHTEQMF